jgi:hypothetical protein
MDWREVHRTVIFVENHGMKWIGEVHRTIIFDENKDMKWIVERCIAP